ncbi:hypothetical protein KJ865_01705, partial [Myxococcota bacterium]|nr:hypothetical protein [Myxococcota bacterium]
MSNQPGGSIDSQRERIKGSFSFKTHQEIHKTGTLLHAVQKGALIHKALIVLDKATKEFLCAGDHPAEGKKRPKFI